MSIPKFVGYDVNISDIFCVIEGVDVETETYFLMIKPDDIVVAIDKVKYDGGFRITFLHPQHGIIFDRAINQIEDIIYWAESYKRIYTAAAPNEI